MTRLNIMFPITLSNEPNETKSSHPDLFMINKKSGIELWKRALKLQHLYKFAFIAPEGPLNKNS